jgi:hypothetical protein
MSWEAIGAIGEVGGALVVAATLAFLVVQVRQISKAINATITHGNIAGFNELNTLLAANPLLAEISDRGSADPGRLTAVLQAVSGHAAGLGRDVSVAPTSFSTGVNE